MAETKQQQLAGENPLHSMFLGKFSKRKAIYQKNNVACDHCVEHFAFMIETFETRKILNLSYIIYDDDGCSSRWHLMAFFINRQ